MVLGRFADGMNGLISLGRGNRGQAALSFAAMVPIVGWGATAVKLGGKNIVKEANEVLSAGEILRIENAAKRINKPITVVGSRAKGTAGAYSDWDYIIEGGLNSREWSKIKNSLPGAKSATDNLPRMIDIHTGPIDLTKPYITIGPR